MRKIIQSDNINTITPNNPVTDYFFTNLQVMIGKSYQRMLQIVATSLMRYPEDPVMCSEWPASPKQGQDLSVILHHLLLWQYHMKVKTLAHALIEFI